MKKILIAILSLFSACEPALCQTSPPASRTFYTTFPPANGWTPANFGFNRDVLCDSVAGREYIQRAKGIWSETFVIGKGQKGNDGANAIMQIGLVQSLPEGSTATANVKPIGNNTYGLDLGIPIGRTGANGIQGQQGQAGTNGAAATINVGTTNTGAAGTLATVTNSGTSSAAIFNFTIPRGADGSGGGSINGIIAPVACNCTSGADDATLQNAFDNAANKVVWLSGTYNITKGLKRSKYFTTIINGNGTIKTLNNNTYDIIGADQPTSVNDAIVCQNSHLDIQNLTIVGQSNQNGIVPRASSNDMFRNILISGVNWAFRMEFCLQANMVECTALSCSNGAYIGIGSFSGADVNNSQSNYSLLTQFHTHTISQTGIQVFGSYGVKIIDAIFEGNGTIQTCINYDASTSTTTKNLEIQTVHFEQTSGGNTLIKLNSRDATVLITDVITHYPILIVDATSSTGNGNVIIERCNYAAQTSDGKFFKSNNVTWQFNYNNAFQTWNIPTMWQGTAPKHYTGSAGYNQWFSTDVPR